MRARRWRRALLAPVGVAFLLAGCGGDGGGRSGSSCHAGEALAGPDSDAVADAGVASRPLLGIAAGVRGAPDVAANIAPVASPGYQRIEEGKDAEWEVAVLQLTDRARTLSVDFGDGAGGASFEVPAGDGACIFDVSHTYEAPGDRRRVKFTLAGGPTFEASVDVAPKS